MARARNIKPGFARNEDLAECSFAARLLFALLPTLADREGRLEDRPKRIKAELFPFDSIEAGPLLDELDRWGLIARYVVDGQSLIQILAFVKHQNPHHKEPPSTLPSHPSLRLDADGKWVKPGLTPDAKQPESETPPASDDTEAQDESETSPKPAEKRHVPTVLIPDSGFRIPESPIPPAAPPTPAAGRFAEFWEAWPRSTRKGGRAECEKLWTSRKLDQQADAILAHVRHMRGTHDWTKDGGQFIPAPVVYLRGGRWDGADSDGAAPGDIFAEAM